MHPHLFMLVCECTWAPVCGYTLKCVCLSVLTHECAWALGHLCTCVWCVNVRACSARVNVWFLHTFVYTVGMCYAC